MSADTNSPSLLTLEERVTRLEADKAAVRPIRS
jgi:hypothetical protein